MNNKEFDKHIRDLLGNLKAPKPDGSWDAFEQKLEQSQLGDQQIEEISRKALSGYEVAYKPDSWGELSDKLDLRSEKLHLWRLKGMEATILVLALLLFLRIDSVYQLRHSADVPNNASALLATETLENSQPIENILTQTSLSRYTPRSLVGQNQAKERLNEEIKAANRPVVPILESQPMTYLEPMHVAPSLRDETERSTKVVSPVAERKSVPLAYDYPVEQEAVMAKLIDYKPKVSKHFGVGALVSARTLTTTYRSSVPSARARGSLAEELSFPITVSPKVTYDIRMGRVGVDFGASMTHVRFKNILSENSIPEMLLTSIPVNLRYYLRNGENLEVYLKGGVTTNMAILANYEADQFNFSALASENSVAPDRWRDGFLNTAVLENQNISFDYNAAIGVRAKVAGNMDFVLETVLRRSTGANKFGVDYKTELKNTMGFFVGLNYGL